jgi:hypothetical protein
MEQPTQQPIDLNKVKKHLREQIEITSLQAQLSLNKRNIAVNEMEELNALVAVMQVRQRVQERANQGKEKYTPAPAEQERTEQPA